MSLHSGSLIITFWDHINTITIKSLMISKCFMEQTTCLVNGSFSSSLGNKPSWTYRTAKPLIVLRFWTWGSVTSHRKAVYPWQIIKKNCYTVVSDGENLTVLEFFAVGNFLTAVLFVLSRVANYFHNLKYLQFSRFFWAFSFWLVFSYLIWRYHPLQLSNSFKSSFTLFWSLSPMIPISVVFKDHIF